jgi:hypothetical protein
MAMHEAMQRMAHRIAARPAVSLADRARAHALTAALAGALAAALAPGVSHAQQLDAELANCKTVNCGGVVVSGAINTHQWNLSGGSSVNIPHLGVNPWVTTVRAGLQECLRLDVLRQNVVIELVVVSPSGIIWRNGGRGKPATCVSCPLVEINGTGQSGYYVVQVNPREGGLADGTFKLAYGRYNKGNLNCSKPTTPLG